jgi:hypothetical protein
VHAQQIGSKDDCRTLRYSPDNTKQEYVVDQTEVTVVTANQNRCEAIVENVGDQVLRCTALADGPPTATTGYPLVPGKTLALGLAGQRGWQCIRDTDSTDTGLVSVLELFP